MRTPDDKFLPARTGMRRVIWPWEFRHLRGIAQIRIGGGLLLLIFAGVLLPYVPWWALLPFAGALANFALAYWYVTIARSAPGANTHQTNNNPVI